MEHPLSSVAVIALAGHCILLVTTPHHIEEALDSVEWNTLMFFAVCSYSLAHLVPWAWLRL